MSKLLVIIRVNKHGYTYGDSHRCTDAKLVTFCGQTIDPNFKWQVLPDGLVTCYECLAAINSPKKVKS